MDAKDRQIIQIFEKLVELPETRFDDLVEAVRCYHQNFSPSTENANGLSGFDQYHLEGKTREVFEWLRDTMVKEGNQNGKVKVIHFADRLFSLMMKKGDQEIKCGNYASARSFFQKALEAAESARSEKEKFAARCALGSILRDQCRFSEASSYFHALLREHTLSYADRSKCLYELTICAKHLRKYSEGLKYAGHAYDMASKAGEKQMMAKVINATGTIHDDLGDYEMALNCYRQSLKIIEEISDYWLYGIVTGNYALTYINMDDFNNGLELTGKALDMAEEVGNKRIVAEQLDNFCDAFIKIGDLDQLRENALQLIDYAKENEYHHLLCNGYCYLGRSYLLKQDNSSALEIFKQAKKVKEKYRKEWIS